MRMEQLVDLELPELSKDTFKPWEVDPKDGRPTWIDVTEGSVKIYNPADSRLFFRLMDAVGELYEKRLHFQAYPVFRLLDEKGQL